MAETFAGKRILLVGVDDPIHVGAFLRRAAGELGLAVRFLDSRAAFDRPRWVVALNWRLRGHTPPRLSEFSRRVSDACADFRPDWLLSTGVAPVRGQDLRRIARAGARLLNFLTDDPWNPTIRSGWFLEALPAYHHVFSPRLSNLEQLRALGCGQVTQLPFAYSPETHFPQQPEASERAAYDCDLLFIGGADPERAGWIDHPARSGFSLRLYGGYWPRYSRLRRYARGHADPQQVRKAVSGAKVVLCLVRGANRDGHSMRSFEVPAMRGCALVQDTPEHRALFGAEGGAALYFRDGPELCDKLRRLLANPEQRRVLAENGHRLITGAPNTYKDRLAAMLGARG